MKKTNNKGFTLIELLAVITIMGILMMVAIPAVSRTIENSRRDTFADITHEYVNAVRNAMLADNIECYDSTQENKDWHVASATPTGVYYFPICTTADDKCSSASTYSGCTEDATSHKISCTGTIAGSTITNEKIVQSTSDLMESGGKSPFGNSEMYGYVKMIKEVDIDTGKTTMKYWVKLMDSGGHGIPDETQESQVKRSAISVAATPEDGANILQGGNVAMPEQKLGVYVRYTAEDTLPDGKKVGDIKYNSELVGARVCKVS